jgi:hypothetical protein
MDAGLSLSPWAFPQLPHRAVDPPGQIELDVELLDWWRDGYSREEIVVLAATLERR